MQGENEDPGIIITGMLCLMFYMSLKCCHWRGSIGMATYIVHFEVHQSAANQILHAWRFQMRQFSDKL